MPNIQSPSQTVGQADISESQVNVSEGSFQPTQDTADGVLQVFYRLKSHYLFNDRILAMPVAGRNSDDLDSYCFARTAKTTCGLIIEWEVWQKGQRPQLPNPYISDPWLVLLKHEPSFSNIDNEADTLGYFHASGTYYYAWRRRNRATVGYPRPPHVELTAREFVIVYPADFVDGLTNAGWPNQASQPAVTPLG